MKKSDILIAVVVLRSNSKLTSRQTRTDLSSVLKECSFDLETWDQDVDPVISDAVIKHLGSVRGELSLADLVLDIDMILKRIC